MHAHGSKQGTTPTLDPEAWATLSQAEQQAVYADYQAINETPGVTPGTRLQPPEKLAERVPADRLGGAIEVRPIMEW